MIRYFPLRYLVRNWFRLFSARFISYTNIIYNNKKAKPIVVDKNFTLIRSMGIDPSNVKFFKEYKSLGSSEIEFNYGNISYYNTNKNVLAYTKQDVEDDINALNLKEGVTYGLIPMSVGFKNTPGTDYISLSEQFIITDKTDKNLIYDNLSISVALARARYSDEEIDHRLVFRLRPISMAKKIYESASVNQFTVNPEVKNLIPKDGFNKKLFVELIPLSYDLKKFGTKIDEKYVQNGVEMPGDLYIYTHDIRLYVMDEKIEESNSLFRKIIVLKHDQNTNKFNNILEAMDFINLSETVFTRKIRNNTLYIDNLKEIIINFEQTLITIPINKTKRNLIHDLNIATFDIETFIDNDDRFIPFACGWYLSKPKGKNSNENIEKSQLYYLTDFDGYENMLLKSLKDLIRLNPGTVYIHNLSRFDSIFLTKILFNNFNVTPLYKDNKILSLTVILKEDKKTYKMKLKDSLLLLPGSLKSLGNDFNVETHKGVFPYKFPNADNLEYIGNKPDISCYEDISLNEYNNIPENNWNLREETEKYLKADLECLHQIMTAFSKDIFYLENINITQFSTISSLAWNIFKSNYLKHDIRQVKGPIHTYMRNAFIGGRVDVFKPYCKNGYIYDVNSLYPAMMCLPMPIGSPTISFDTNLDNYFGVVYANITTPKNIKYPPLPFRSDKKLFNPLGSFSGWYFSEELKFVRDTYGYKIDVIGGAKLFRFNLELNPLKAKDN